MIDRGEKRGAKIKEEDKVRALHIEIDTKTSEEDKERIKALFSEANSDPGDYPLGYPLRFIPVWRSVHHPGSHTKIKHMINRQAAFQKNVLIETCHHIKSLDKKIFHSGHLTIRDLLLKIPVHPSNPTSRVFVSVEEHPSDPGAIRVAFLPQHEEVARNLLSSTLTVLRYHGAIIGADTSSLDRVYSQHAIAEATNCSFDPETGLVVSQADNYMGSILGLDAQFDFTTTEEDDNKQEPEAVQVEDMPRRIVHMPNRGAGEVDSVTTFASGELGGKRTRILRSDRNVQPRTTQSNNKDEQPHSPSPPQQRELADALAEAETIQAVQQETILRLQQQLNEQHLHQQPNPLPLQN